MKKLFLLSLFVGLSMTALNAQEAKQDNNTKDKSAVVEKPLNGPQIEFAEQVHDYGKVKKGGDGNCEFVFTNTGNEPLILSNVKASCGCTVPTWTKEPIMPGKTGTIKVRYNTNTSPQSFTKTITVSSNSINAPRLTLKIKGTIVE